MAKRKEEGMPTYLPSDEERKWYLHCVRQGIRISPGAIVNTKDKWTIDISVDGKTWRKSPKQYDRNEIWPTFYQMHKYYYEKRK